LEDDLDEIASGDAARTTWLKRFYFGENGDNGLKDLVEKQLGDIDAREINTVPLPRTDIVVRVGKYGPYLERGEERQTLPPDIAPDELHPRPRRGATRPGQPGARARHRPGERPHGRSALRPRTAPT